MLTVKLSALLACRTGLVHSWGSSALLDRGSLQSLEKKVVVPGVDDGEQELGLKKTEGLPQSM